MYVCMYIGDPTELSMKAAFYKIFRLENELGSTPSILEGGLLRQVLLCVWWHVCVCVCVCVCISIHTDHTCVCVRVNHSHTLAHTHLCIMDRWR